MTLLQRLGLVEDLARDLRTVCRILAEEPDRDDAPTLRLRRAALAVALAGHVRAVERDVR